MKPIIRNICLILTGIVLGILITWVAYGNYLNNFAKNSWLERVASDTDTLRFLREKSYDKAIGELESNLSIHLLLLASYNKSLDSIPKKEVRLLKLTARERSLNPFRTGDQNIDPPVENLLANVLTNQN
jgi:hypothetical protein